jgi:hypothetical protein
VGLIEGVVETRPPQIQRGDLGDDGQVEAVRVGVIGAQPAVAQGHKEPAVPILAQLLGHRLELLVCPKRLLGKVLPPLKPPAMLVQSGHKAAAERADRAAADRLEQASIERRVRRRGRVVLRRRRGARGGSSPPEKLNAKPTGELNAKLLRVLASLLGGERDGAGFRLH